MHDVIIIGGGIAGLTAAIYCGRYKLKTLVVSKETGGIITDAHLVENWPGFIKISGTDLMERVEEQVKELGVEIKEETVLKIEKNNAFKIKTKKNKYEAKTLIITTGTERRKLNVPGEQKFLKKGVHYCATCDAPWYQDKVVALVGGGNSAVRAAQILSEYAKKIHMIFIEKESEMLAEPFLADWAKANKKIKIYPEKGVVEVKGDKKVESVVLSDKTEIKADGVFVEIGYFPQADLFKNLKIKTDKKGFIDVDKEQKTNLKGVFAAGDITNASDFKQLVTAGAQGAVAAFSVYRFLK